MAKTWKRLTASLLSLVLLCSLITIPAQAATNAVTLGFKNGKWNGTEYSVDVTLTGNGGNFPIYSGEFYVSFDQDILQYEKRTLGTIAAGTNDEGDTVQITPNSSDKTTTNENGYFTMVYSSTANHTITSGQTLLTLFFTVKPGVETCKTQLSFEAPAEKTNIFGYWDGAANAHHTVISTAVQETTVPGAAPTLASVALSAASVTVDGSNGSTVNASATSAKGTPITNDVAWSVAPAGKGVTVAANGAITVDAKAEADSYTVTATPNGTSVLGTAKSATLTVTRATSVATAVKIYKNSTAVGSTDTIIIPVAGAAANTYTYTAKLFDQFDTEMTGTVTWNWNPAVGATGVTHNSGVVTVAAGATKDAEYSLVATIEGKSAAVTLTAKDIDITWPTATVKNNPTYGDTWAQIVTLGNNGSANLNGANIPGKFTVEGETASNPAAGEQTYIIRFKSDDNQYNVTTTGTVEIAKKVLTVLPGDFSVAKEYDGNNTVPETAIISGSLGLSGKIGNDDVSLNPVTRGDLGTYSGTNISNNLTIPVTVSLTGAAAGNYTVVSPYNFPNARITKTLPKLEHFTVTVPDAFTYDSKTAGTAKVEVKASVTGMGAVTVLYAKQNADGTTYGTPTATAPVNAGTYKVVARIAEGANFAYLNELDTEKTFTIAKAERTLTVKNTPLTLLPNAKTAALELEYPNLDNSAKVTYELAGDKTAVSRNGNSFTAVENGAVTVTVKIAATDNYEAATDATATVNAIVNPVESVSAATDSAEDKVAASLSGSTITVSGIKGDASTLTVTVTPVTVGGVTLTSVVTENKVEIKSGDTVVATYTIDKSGLTVKPANMTVTEQPKVEGSNIAGSEVEGAAASTAGSLIDEAKKWETANKGKLEEHFDGKTYTVEVKVNVAISEKSYESGTKLNLNITPTYTIIAYEKDNTGNKYYDEAPSEIEIPQRAIKTPITIKVKLPGGFVPNYAKHSKNGALIEYLKVKVENGVAVWQQSSFSDVELGRNDNKVTITYPLSADAEQAVKHDIFNLALPVPSGSGTFNGWTFTNSAGEKIGPLTVLTEADLATLAGWSDVTATSAGFYHRPSGGGSSGGSSYVPTGTYPVNVKRPSNGTVSASPTHAKKGDTVTLTVKPNTGYELDSITVTDKDGNTVRVREKETNVYTFTMPDSAVSVEAIFKAAETKPVNPFRDVSSGAYYYDAVLWAVENGVTGGTTATTFSPGNACTRAQTVTFLWRAAGSPAPASRNNPFTDVAPGAYYYDAVLWAVEKGITTGVTATTFGPNATVNRGQVVTFLSRSAKAAPVNGANPFTDVPANAYYANAVLWAVENGITNGTTATQFSPAAPCTRGQIVTFLYRYFV